MTSFVLPSDIVLGVDLHPDPSTRDDLVTLFAAAAALNPGQDITGNREVINDDPAAMYRFELQQFELYRTGFGGARPRNWKLLAITEHAVKRRLESARAKEMAECLAPLVKPWKGLTLKSIDGFSLINYPETDLPSQTKGRRLAPSPNTKGLDVGVFDNWEVVSPLVAVSGAVFSNEKTRAAAEKAFHLQNPILQFIDALLKLDWWKSLAETLLASLEGLKESRERLVGLQEISLAATALEGGKSGVDKDARVALTEIQTVPSSASVRKDYQVAATSGILQPGFASSLSGPARICQASWSFQTLPIITISSFCPSYFLAGHFLLSGENAEPAETREKVFSIEQILPTSDEEMQTLLAHIEESRRVRRYIQHPLGSPDPPTLDWIRSQRVRWDWGYLVAPDVDMHREIAQDFQHHFPLYAPLKVGAKSLADSVACLVISSVALEKAYVTETRQAMQARTNAQMARCTLLVMAMAVSNARHEHHIQSLPGTIWTFPEELQL
ncbi:hypothetical protein C8J56DRAFT_885561 [Mycena floridula]|nr:hypothetical protein C8J56DRAFT_885561 [Mycena floridula]